jgi:hypothetical protein
VRVCRQKFTLEDAIGPHASSLEASRRVTNGIPLGCPRFLPVHTVKCVQTLKVNAMGTVRVFGWDFGRNDPCSGGTCDIRWGPRPKLCWLLGVIPSCTLEEAIEFHVFPPPLEALPSV